MNNWKDEAGDWHNDFNAIAWAAETNGRQMKYEKNTKHYFSLYPFYLRQVQYPVSGKSHLKYFLIMPEKCIEDTKPLRLIDKEE